MLRLRIEPDFAEWRDAARKALASGYLPNEIDFQDASEPQQAEFAIDGISPASGQPFFHPFVPKPFLSLAEAAAVHRDSQRWNLLYRILYRLQTQRGLLHVEVDDDIALLHKLDRQVHRDVHKMHAFVRFRKVQERSDDGAEHEHFIAGYKPDHRILPLAAPFFAERFAVMRWTIFTPDQSASWSPENKLLEYGAGFGMEHAPQEDELEDLWRSYYGAIFNPARMNPRAMRGEMPVRYWRNLPEVALLPNLIQQAGERVAVMVNKQEQQPTAAPFVPEKHTLNVLREAMPACRGCDLYRCATQVVPGRGAARAALLLVGEQPGDQEDLQGEPFVGPAGGVLRKALAELSIQPKDLFLTNAVKHFKYVQRGKFRMHQSPRMSEINACRPWLLAELDAVRPHVVLCLGASAAKSLLGGTFALMKDRGTIRQTPYAERVMATVHPSAVLRARDERSREELYRFLKDDLAAAYLEASRTR